MSFFIPTACQVPLMGLALGGLISNIFIIAVIVTGWIKSMSLNSNEQLLLSLSVSNVCSTASLSAVIYELQFQIMSRNIIMIQAFYSIWNFALLSRSWFTAWLCVFYCIKIVNSTHSLFLWCKRRISCLLPWILAASAAISTLSSVFSLHRVPVCLQSNTTSINITDIGQGELTIAAKPSYLTFFVIGSSCPLLVVFLSSFMTVASLYRHVCQMRGKESGFRSPQTQVHFKAAGTVLFLLFLYLSYYIAAILLSIGITKNNNVIVVCTMVLMGYSPAQASILVWVNPKLKQAVSQMLPCRKP